ncbi:hypothetical protein CEXT_693391 [Caerostris extrusa]|uniref:Uncharacterized protein n=1 Tax=Caerostris extrusa TaxID=172846 RepID=A0AAV4XQS5_CAEEX|nr:hypothetical protein CEXT_693391 [Caerostris extrusa]
MLIRKTVSERIKGIPYQRTTANSGCLFCIAPRNLGYDRRKQEALWSGNLFILRKGVFWIIKKEQKNIFLSPKDSNNVIPNQVAL